MKRSRILLLVVAASSLLAIELAPGCSAQSEGQLCSTLNNNDDCQAGLTCNTSGFCCPPPPMTSTHPDCQGTGAGGGAMPTSTSTGMGGMGGMASSSSMAGTGGMASSSSTSSSSSSSSSSSASSTGAGMMDAGDGG